MKLNLMRNICCDLLNPFGVLLRLFGGARLRRVIHIDPPPADGGNCHKVKLF